MQVRARTFNCTRRNAPARPLHRRASRPVTCYAQAVHAPEAGRRRVLLGLLTLPGLAVMPAEATPLQDLTRTLLRPEVSNVDAVVALMDARSTLKQIAVSLSI